MCLFSPSGNAWNSLQEDLMPFRDGPETKRASDPDLRCSGEVSASQQHQCGEGRCANRQTRHQTVGDAVGHPDFVAKHLRSTKRFSNT